MFRTPYTEKLHVVERFKVAADNKSWKHFDGIHKLDTFNEPMYMTKRWLREPNEWIETICAENSSDDVAHNLIPIPKQSVRRSVR